MGNTSRLRSGEFYEKDSSLFNFRFARLVVKKHDRESYSNPRWFAKQTNNFPYTANVEKKKKKLKLRGLQMANTFSFPLRLYHIWHFNDDFDWLGSSSFISTRSVYGTTSIELWFDWNIIKILCTRNFVRDISWYLRDIRSKTSQDTKQFLSFIFITQRSNWKRGWVPFPNYPY